jgi:very-short-patch-repair endonuclease
MCVNPASAFPGSSLVVMSEGRSILYINYDDPFPSFGGVSEGRGGQNDYRRTNNAPNEGRGGQNDYRRTNNAPNEGRGGHNAYNKPNNAPTEGRGGQDDYNKTNNPPNRPHRNTRNYKALPYNPKLKKWAKENRQAGNLSEVKFWNEVKRKQFKGFDFDRQKIIGNYIVDFYCSTRNVVVEIDGSSHDNKQEYDARRDAYLKSLGLTVIHIRVEEIFNGLDVVMKKLNAHPALS